MQPRKPGQPHKGWKKAAQKALAPTRRPKRQWRYSCIADCTEHGWLPSASCPNCERDLVPVSSPTSTE
jgi:hypothetical protein